jgi:hypothetical protein
MSHQEDAMIPVMLHADGTVCYHDGPLQRTLPEESGPLCGGGQPVTHVRFHGKVVTIEEAAAAVEQMAGAFARALESLGAGLAEFGRRISADPALRALAAAYEEQRREASERIDGGGR